MQPSFLGLSLTYWAIPCLMMAAIWTIIWPSYRAQNASPLRRLVLRWAHALTWLLLAIALLLAGTGLAGGGRTAAVLGVLALVAYISFLYVTLTTNQIPYNSNG